MNMICTHSFFIQLLVLCSAHPPAVQLPQPLTFSATWFPTPTSRSLAYWYIDAGPQPLALCQTVYRAIAAVAFQPSLSLLHPVCFFSTGVFGLLSFALFAWYCCLPVVDLHLPADFAPHHFPPAPALPFDYLNCWKFTQCLWVMCVCMWVQSFCNLWYNQKPIF